MFICSRLPNSSYISKPHSLLILAFTHINLDILCDYIYLDGRHLCFKQAQPKMCHSPKVDDGVEF